MKAWSLSMILVVSQVPYVNAYAGAEHHHAVSTPAGTTRLRPMSHSAHVNPDARLRITFPSTPPLGNRGKIRVYDASNDSLVDELDMSVPPGPKNNRSRPPYGAMTYDSIPDTVYSVYSPDTDPTHVYQRNYIGGSAEGDAYHFFPVLIDDDTATICLHNNRLAYDKVYYVQIDPEVFPFSDGSFRGITGKADWVFRTKHAPPAADSRLLVVSADGRGDFDTVQGAIDSIPDDNPDPKTIFLRSGIYEEIVYFRNKANITLLGEDREKVVIRYANNGVFNPKLVSSGHNMRAVFAVHKSKDIKLINFTTLSMGEPPAQAEGLYISGQRIQVHNVSIIGSGDALQAVGTIYLSESSILGYGDNVLGSGAVFFNRCELGSTYGPHLWVRNTDQNHGNVFLNSTFYTVGDVATDIARAPTNNGINYPYAEAVLINCTLEGVRPGGWGAVGPDTSNLHYWEYNSVDTNGQPVDVSQRAPYSRQLTMENDAQIIADFSDPAFVLGGWTPELTPIILTHPARVVEIAEGGSAELRVGVAAAPVASYQWFKNGRALAGQTDSTLRLGPVTAADSGVYRVHVRNTLGAALSHEAHVIAGASCRR